MDLHCIHGRCRPIVCRPYGAPRSVHKGFISAAVCILLPVLTYLPWYTRLHMVQLFTQVPKGVPGVCYQSWGIYLLALCMILRVQHIIWWDVWKYIHFTDRRSTRMSHQSLPLRMSWTCTAFLKYESINSTFSLTVFLFPCCYRSYLQVISIFHEVVWVVYLTWFIKTNGGKLASRIYKYTKQYWSRVTGRWFLMGQKLNFYLKITHMVLKMGKWNFWFIQLWIIWDNLVYAW